MDPSSSFATRLERDELIGRVHGGERKEGIVITKNHTEGLEEMDKLSDFAPLHVSFQAPRTGDKLME